MKIVLETTNEEFFKANFGILTDYIEDAYGNIEYEEDPVGFGAETLLITSIVFILNAVVSGVIWDIIKPFIKNNYGNLKRIKEIDNTNSCEVLLEVNLKNEKIRYQITIDKTNGSVEIKNQNEEILKPYSKDEVL